MDNKKSASQTLASPALACPPAQAPVPGINLCACLGPIYGEPHCPCTMKRLGMPPSDARLTAEAAARVRLADLFATGVITTHD